MYRVRGLPGFPLNRGAEPANDLPFLRSAGAPGDHGPEPELDEPPAAHGCYSKRAEPAPTARREWWRLLLRRKLHASQACRGEDAEWKAGAPRVAEKEPEAVDAGALADTGEGVSGRRVCSESLRSARASPLRPSLFLKLIPLVRAKGVEGDEDRRPVVSALAR